MARRGAILPTRTFKPGEVIFSQGDAMSGEAYLVYEGKVRVRKETGGGEQVLRVLGEGDLLGEVALFRNAPHSATAVAVGRVTLQVISADRLEEMVRANPGLAIAIIRQLARMVAGEDGARGRAGSRGRSPSIG